MNTVLDIKISKQLEKLIKERVTTTFGNDRMSSAYRGVFVMVNKEWAKRFHEELEEDAKERLWNILTDEERKIVNDYKFYKDIHDKINRNDTMNKKLQDIENLAKGYEKENLKRRNDNAF